jgi:hypothetical protein
MARSLGRDPASWRVPYGAHVSAPRAAAIAFAFPAFAHLVDTVRLVPSHQRGVAALAVAASMLVVRYGCARRAFFSRRIAGMFGWAVAGVLVAGGLEFSWWLHGLGPGIPARTFTATAWATFLEGPVLQAAYGSTFILIQRGFVAERSDESADQVVVAAGVWLTTVPFDCSAVFSRTSALARSPFRWFPPMPGPISAWTTTVPLALALVALARLALRRRWIARVGAGREPPWQLVLWDGAVPPGLPTLARTTPSTPPFVLVTPRTGETPYRTADSLEPRAALLAREGRHRRVLQP